MFGSDESLVDHRAAFILVLAAVVGVVVGMSQGLGAGLLAGIATAGALHVLIGR